MKEERDLSIAKKRYLFWVITIGLFIVSLMIIKPFAISLISAFILAFLVKPLYDSLSKKLGKSASAALCLLTIIIILILPTVLLTVGIINQAKESLTVNTFESITEKISEYPILEKINLESLKEKFISYILSVATSILAYIPALFISTIIVLLGTYYILINWSYLAKNLTLYIPFSDKQRVADEISLITKSIVHGYLFIAILEFGVAFIGFYIFGVKYFILLAMLIAFLAFIPGLGPVAVWLPLALYYLINNNYFTAIGVIITGLIISVIIEIILLGKIISKNSKIHPLIFLMGIFGGIPIFGIFGFVLGPLVLVYAIKLLHEGIEH
ncbi:MAG: AI-2E family transporter [Nanoarchaeota archaeon]